MDYLVGAEKEIREGWFKNHIVKSIEGKEGLRRISWGEEGTGMYQVNYVLSDNMIFVTGDLGDATYRLTCQATLDNIKDFDLSYFTGKLTANERSKYNFDSTLAQEHIEEYIFDWCDVGHVDQLDVIDQELYEDLYFATNNWSSVEHFKTAVYSIYEHTNASWFDGEAASCIADCGQRLGRSFIAYWVGLQMAIEQLDKCKSKLVTA